MWVEGIWIEFFKNAIFPLSSDSLNGSPVISRELPSGMGFLVQTGWSVPV